jgi:phosphoserine phosphatase RsbU/P
MAYGLMLGIGTMLRPSVLVADDQPDILQALRLLLAGSGFDTDLVRSVDDVLTRLGQRSYDLLLMDLNYTRDTTSGREGLSLIDQAHAQDPTLPIVVMTGWGNIDMAVDAMRRGARSFVQKPWDNTTLVQIARREVEEGIASRRRDATVASEQEEATLIQRALLPSTVPQLPGCDTFALWNPASGIGGDCYDLIKFSESQLALSIADVVGKGLPAALLMSNLQAAVRAFASPGARPHDVCASVNRLLCRNVVSGKFVTFCYAVIDTIADTVSYGNAGHNPPLLVRADGRLDVLQPTGIPLGIFPDSAYQSGQLAFGRGDRLVFFTDGITEACSTEDEEFGDTRLLDLIRAAPGGSARQLAETIAEAASRWAGGAHQDDATLIVISRI